MTFNTGYWTKIYFLFFDFSLFDAAAITHFLLDILANFINR